MPFRLILGLVSSIFVLVLVAAPASSAPAPDAQCGGELIGVTVRNVTVPSGASCTLRNSTVTGRVSAGAGSYFQAIHTGIAGDVAGTDAQTLFVDVGSTVGGSVRGNRVSQVFLFASRIQKDVKIARATDQVFICGSTVERGSIEVTHSARNIVIGNSQAGGCAGNSVRQGDMSVLQNTTDVQLVVRSNRFPKGNLIVRGNTGPSQKIVQGNLGGKRIACQANAGRFTASQNRRWKSSGCSTR
jgi:hypothetical protein